MAVILLSSAPHAALEEAASSICLWVPTRECVTVLGFGLDDF